MVISAARVLLIAAVVCFVIALAIALGADLNSTWEDWIAGGLVSASLAKLVP